MDTSNIFIFLVNEEHYFEATPLERHKTFYTFIFNIKKTVFVCKFCNNFASVSDGIRNHKDGITAGSVSYVFVQKQRTSKKQTLKKKIFLMVT